MGRELPIKPKQGMEICFDLNVYLFFTTEKKERKKERRGEMEIENSNKFLCATGVDKYRRQLCKFGPNRMGAVITH